LAQSVRLHAEISDHVGRKAGAVNAFTSSFLKDLLRNSIRRLGFEIRKFPRSEFQAAPVFDIVVQLFMAKHGESVSFIQVGANDGSFVDPLRRYILNYPWHGILVEPQEAAFKTLQANYAAAEGRLKFENAAVSDGASSISMYRAPSNYEGDKTYAASVVSADPEVAARQLNIDKSRLEQFSVRCITLDDLVDKYSVTKLDFLQIDTEGHDWHVLKTATLSRISPSIIQFEHGHLSNDTIDKVAEFLDVNEYSIYWGGHQGDSIALSKSFIEALAGGSVI
jgi:FkbM family methyltransferase